MSSVCTGRLRSPPMADRSDLHHILTRSADFYNSLHDVLGDALEVDNHRDLLTQGTCGVAVEHGVSVCLLVEADNVASAIALQRPQFEAVVRALWLHEIATAEWIERYFEAVKSNPLKDPNFSPSVGDMLEAVSKTRHLPAVRMLSALKDAAWGPMNSYIHSGIHPVVQHHAGFPPEYAIQTVWNSNGLSGMAATLMAIVLGDPEIARQVRRVQLDHSDCLPPLHPTPTPPSNSPV